MILTGGSHQRQVAFFLVIPQEVNVYARIGTLILFNWRNYFISGKSNVTHVHDGDTFL